MVAKLIETNCVNASGQPLNIERLQQKYKAPPKRSAEKAVVFRGWSVVGYSPERWAECIAAHAASTCWHLPLVEFARPWMERHKPKRTSVFFHSESSAHLYADLLRKSGWFHVQVKEPS